MAAGSHTEWPQLPSQPSISQWCLEMERMNGREIFRKQTFAKNSSRHLLGKARERKGTAREVEELWFCHAHPIAFLVWCSNSSSGANPYARGATVPEWEFGCIWRWQGMGVSCLQLIAIQLTLASASPHSTPEETAGPACANPCPTALACTGHRCLRGHPKPRLLKGRCLCYADALASLRKTQVLNSIKHLDAFPFPAFSPASQQVRDGE